MTRVKYEYKSEEEKQRIISENTDKYLIEYQFLKEGNFLIFTDVKPIENDIIDLKQENTLLKAQNQALTTKTDFHEDVLTEIILELHS